MKLDQAIQQSQLVTSKVDAPEFVMPDILPSNIKIYLDDERTAPDGYIRCYLPSEVIALLEKCEKGGTIVDDLSLDHDIGGDNYVKPITGYDVLLWIKEQVANRGYVPPKYITIHTQDASAHKKMTLARYSIYKRADEMKLNWRHQKYKVKELKCPQCT